MLHIYKNIKGITCIALFALFHLIVSPTVIAIAVAAEPTLPDITEQQSYDVRDLIPVPDLPANVGLDSEGYPIGAGRGYTPAQMNMLLGKAVVMTAVDCIKKYGQYFCACTTLDDGTSACYHRTPSAGYYSFAVCEEIWGVGQCECAEEKDSCYKKSEERPPTLTSCLDQIFFFPGEKLECRNSGIMTMGTDCCINKDALDNSCSFENVAKTMGLSDFAMVALSIASMLNKASSLFLEKSLQDMAATYFAEELVKAWIKDGATGMIGDMVKFFGSSVTEASINTITSIGVEQGAEMSGQVATQAIAGTASVISGAISIVGWIYTAYSIYNMITEMQECSPGEMILGCKLAKKICTRVGKRCKVKILGACLQDMTVYCCFNSQLARIIHEQGRPQIGMTFGSPKKAICRGFYPNEFMQLNFATMDFSEYAQEITKQMSVKFTEKAEEAAKRAMENFSF